eukprot:scaffold14427_cov94-Skeletonema_dohrnii-CCMP3373.AAC.1
MAVKSMMRHVLSTPVNDVLQCDVGDIIGRMSGLQDTDTSPWVYIIEWCGDKASLILLVSKSKMEFNDRLTDAF